MKTDHWFYGLFQSAPDLIALLLPQGVSVVPSLGPDSPGDALYRFEAPELKAANHRLDGVFWPRSAEAGTPERPVVLLEVQMHAKAGFQHRLGAQSFRFLQLHPQVLHLGSCQERCHPLEAFYASFAKATGRLVCWVANGSFIHTKSGCFQLRIDLLQRLGFAMRASS